MVFILCAVISGSTQIGTLAGIHFLMSDDVLFDYRLHKGISRTQNAVRLLEAMGFPAEFVSDAKEKCRKAEAYS